MPPAQRNAAVASAIRRTALKERATAPISTLSRGYRQRVGVAQALLHSPALLILDEPTNGLDPTQIQHMRELIRELAKSATVLVSTHILQEVQAVCERVLIMRAGKLVVDARIDELRRSDGLLVATQADAKATLAAVPGVESVDELFADERSAASLHRYRVKADASIAPQLARALAQAGVALHALSAQQQDLETVFRRVNEEAAHA